MKKNIENLFFSLSLYLWCWKGMECSVCERFYRWRILDRGFMRIWLEIIMRKKKCCPKNSRIFFPRGKIKRFSLHWISLNIYYIRVNPTNDRKWKRSLFVEWHGEKSTQKLAASINLHRVRCINMCFLLSFEFNRLTNIRLFLLLLTLFLCQLFPFVQ